MLTGMLTGIRGRFVRTYALLVLLALLLTAGGVLAMVRHYYLTSIENLLEVQAGFAARLYREYFAGEDPGRAGQELAEVFAQGTPARVQVLDRAGNLAGDSQDPALREPPGAAPEVALALRGQAGAATGRWPATSERYLAVAAPLQRGGETQGVVRLASSLAAVDRVTLTLGLALGLLGLGAVGVTVLTAGALANTVVRPVTEVTLAAERMARGDLTVRVPVRQRDEVGRLAATLNRMAEELSRLDRLKNEFVASVSHELRTPLTSIKGFAVTLREGLPADACELREGLEVIDREADRLAGLVEELLDFSRLQAGRLTLRCAPVRVDDLVRETVRQMRPRAGRLGIGLTAVIAPGVPPVDGDRDRLKQVLVNLLDNALKFTPAGGRVEVGVAPVAHGVRVTVADTGPGIPPEELPRVKERFFRGRAAREGTGLGLALAEELVKRHGGTLEIASDGRSGTQAAFFLPRKR